MHQLLERTPEAEENHGGNERRHHRDRVELRVAHSVIVRREETTQKVGAEVRHEPRTHGKSCELRRRQFVHEGEPDRRQTQLSYGVKRIHTNEPQHAHGSACLEDTGRDHHEDEPDSDEHESVGHFDGGSGLRLLLRHVLPELREQRREDEDEERVDRLEPTCRHLVVPAEDGDVTVGLPLGKQREGGTRLLERHPEEDHEKEQDEDHRDLFPLFPSERRRDDVGAVGVLGDLLALARLAEEPLAVEHDPDADEHADAGREEPPLKAVGLGESSAHERREERAKIDAHVEDRVRAVHARIMRPIIELGHRSRDVGLEEPVPDDEQTESRPEREGMHHEELASGHEEPAEDDARPTSPELVRDVTADERRHVDEPRVPAVHRSCICGRHAVRHGSDIQNEDCAHPVEREALPRLYREKPVETNRVFQRLGILSHDYLLANSESTEPDPCLGQFPATRDEMV